MSISTPPSLDAILRGKYDFYPILYISITHSELLLKELHVTKKGKDPKTSIFIYKNVAEAQHPIDNQKSSELIKF